MHHYSQMQKEPKRWVIALIVFAWLSAFGLFFYLGVTHSGWWFIPVVILFAVTWS